MQIESLYQIFCESTLVTTDSRHCPDGSVFFALKGTNFNGNQYAQKALDAGCAYAVVDDKACVVDQRFVLVDDVLTTLQELANYHRRKLATPIIGITGSNGKTTTKELLATALSSKFNLLYTKGNFNNHIGVPLTLLQLKREHELAIVEMGANHPMEIGELCAIAEPDMGVLTNIGKAHLEGFGGLDGVIETKKELYDFIRAKGGKVFVNAQDELLMGLSEGIDRVLYNGESSVYKVSVKEAIPTLTLHLENDMGVDLLSTHLVGEYNAINIAVALEVGAYLEVSYSSMKQALEAYIPSNNRSQIEKSAKNTIILDAYNANPASMSVAVSNFKKLPDKRKIVMLGAMKELGKYSQAEHQILVDMIDDDEIVLKFMVGEEFGEIERKPENMFFFKSTDELKVYLKAHPIMDALVLIKGSRSMKMEALADLL